MIVSEDPLHVALDEVFSEFGGAKRAALVAHEDRSDVPRFFGATRPEQFSWPHAQQLDREELLCLVSPGLIFRVERRPEDL